MYDKLVLILAFGSILNYKSGETSKSIVYLNVNSCQFNNNGTQLHIVFNHNGVGLSKDYNVTNKHLCYILFPKDSEDKLVNSNCSIDSINQNQVLIVQLSQSAKVFIGTILEMFPQNILQCSKSNATHLFKFANLSYLINVANAPSPNSPVFQIIDLSSQSCYYHHVVLTPLTTQFAGYGHQRYLWTAQGTTSLNFSQYDIITNTSILQLPVL
ncbi:hypothetical protein RFI_05998 [Reticulomyxa filosa]|uniref:Uncharacterized protein n=1 Tax=Reticulomyxa filosa TaxID=46433 RepID=X6NYQ5_RETFI|nr:hypothetical protein RFI_05998 [Reticulomyxa filosa]|eukprot:ETO31121.1 hypothetical protein RFI_05998 [Reticulomyxa filosa]